MKVSVVIPTHNRKHSLTNCLIALASGKTLPDEVVIVDDASKENITLSDFHCIKEDFRSRLIIHRVEEAKGASAARNQGAKLSSCDLLIFLDDDTIPSPELVGAHLLAASENENPNNLVMGRLLFSNHLKSTPLRQWLQERGDFREVSGLLTFNPLGGFVSANFSISRELFLRSGGFDEDFPFNRNEDTEFGIRMRKDFDAKLIFLDTALAYHDSDLKLVGHLENVMRGGVAKAYWAQVNPGHSGIIRDFASAMLLWNNREPILRLVNIWIRIFQPYTDGHTSHWMDRVIARFFESSLITVKQINVHLGLAMGWLLFSPGAKHNLEANRKKTHLAEMLGGGFIAGEWEIVGQLIRLRRFELALDVLQNWEDSEWRQLLEAYCLMKLGKAESANMKLELLESSGLVIDLDVYRCEVAKKVRLLEAGNSRLDHELIKTLFDPRIGSTHFFGRLPRALLKLPLKFFLLVFPRGIAGKKMDAIQRELENYSFRGRMVFAAQRMEFFRDLKFDLLSVFLKKGQQEPREYQVDGSVNYKFKVVDHATFGRVVSGAPTVRLN